ncbi:DUF742 domain-containing protein [Streptomyces sp. NPDC088746]|uniref:DUF742 domain-containing protein n=1 Tax=Streptomyces sp. NPDC088746 TaxID=3365885 RepID=UPI00380AA1E4
MTPAPRRRLVPSFLATDSVQPTRNTLDRLTLLSSTGVTAVDDLTHAQRRLVELLRGGPLALVEVAARLALPVSLVRVLVADLVDSSHLHARAPIPEAKAHDPQLLEKVLDGLRSIR